MPNKRRFRQLQIIATRLFFLSISGKIGKALREPDWGLLVINGLHGSWLENTTREVADIGHTLSVCICVFKLPGVFRTSQVEFSAASAELFIQSCMRILVIGGNGFIGSPLVSELLRSGHQVAVFHRCSDVLVLPTLGLYKSRETGIDFPITKVSSADFLLTSSSI